jgi:hypothetical protein
MPSLINDAPRAADDPPSLRGNTSLLNGDPLRGGAPTLADAYSYNAHALADWVAAQRAESAQRGMWDEARGAPTPAGARDAAMQVAQGVALASTAPKDTPGILGRASMGRMDPVQHILDHVSSDPNSQWGIRVTDDPIDLSKGVLPPSRVWDDGKPTDQVLGGTSTVGIYGDNRAAVERALSDAGVAPYGKPYHYYPGQHVTLVKGDYAGGGDDVGEALIRNATPVATYQKMDDGPSALMPVAPATPMIRAFHGSPHDFDAFDASQIGTGEGAQQYGHGLYVAEQEAVAKSYRAVGRLPATNTAAFIKADDEAVELQRAINGLQNSAMSESQRLGTRTNKDWADVGIKFHPDVEAIYRPKIDALSAQRDAAAAEAQRILREAPRSPGRMYEVEIAADPQHFLDWDKPLSEQSPQVQQALISTGYDPNVVGSARGNELYRELSSFHNDPQAASAALREAGVPGIKYLDAGSRRAGEGTSNYVVFDPSIMRIVRKYAVPAFATSSAIPAAMGGSAQESQ